MQVQAFQVTLRMPSGKTKTMEVGPDEALFDAVERYDVDLPYLCRTGESSCVRHTYAEAWHTRLLGSPAASAPVPLTPFRPTS